MTDHQGERSAPTFRETVKLALDHLNDPIWLGTHSPLSAPYFLGAALQPTADASQSKARGTALQQLILRAALALDPQGDPAANLDRAALREQLSAGTREQKLLYWKYVHHPRQTVQFIIDQLNVARATFHRDVKDRLPEIIQRVADHLLQLVRPSLRLESVPWTPLAGRDDLLHAYASLLRDQRQLQLTGPVGVGKTALAAQLATDWPGPVFWLTLRPELNDSLPGLLLALGLFLHTHGATQLWSQLLADSERINPQVASGLALADLKQLRQPLICLDDSDVIIASEQPQHASVRALLQTLLTADDSPAALLLAGHQPWSGIATQRDVPPLSIEQAALFLQAQQVACTPTECAHVWSYTQGNAQALKMVSVLYHAGESLAGMMASMPTSPSGAIFVRQLLQSLGPAEQGLLRQLSVFRRPVPAHSWPEGDGSLRQLIQRQIVQRDEQDNVRLWPMLRDALDQQLTADERQTLHAQAAALRTQVGQYTAAAYHYVQSGLPSLALQIWFPNREQELRDGQTGAALAVFQGINSQELNARDQQALALALAQLSKRTGNSQQALIALQTAPWSANEPLTAYAQQLEGDLLELRSAADDALRRYEAALSSVAGLLEHQEVHLYARIGNLQMARFRDLDAAWTQARQSRYAAELFQGEVQDERGNYGEARIHYQTALGLAEQLSDSLRQARAHFNLAIVAARREESALATFHFEQTMHWYATLGDLVRTERTRTNLAAFFAQTGRYADAITAASQAFGFFNQVQMPHWIALNAINLADAHAALGQQAEAEHYAQLVLAANAAESRPYALTTLGAIRLQQARPAEAVTLLNEAITAAQAISDQWAEAPAWRQLGQAQSQLAEPAEARQALEQASRLYAALNLPKELSRTQLLLAEVPSA